VTDVTYDLMPGEVLGIVGESGSGKSVSMLSILGLSPQARIPKGEAFYKGRDLLTLPAEAAARNSRWRHGDDLPGPMTSLNPVLTVGTRSWRRCRPTTRG
jgi:ABC-type glutathione transport system ATPase component